MPPEIERYVTYALPGDSPAGGSIELTVCERLAPRAQPLQLISEPADTLRRWACMFFFFSNGLGLAGSMVISILLSLLLLYACSH